VCSNKSLACTKTKHFPKIGISVTLHYKLFLIRLQHTVIRFVSTSAKVKRETQFFFKLYRSFYVLLKPIQLSHFNAVPIWPDDPFNHTVFQIYFTRSFLKNAFINPVLHANIDIITVKDFLRKRNDIPFSERLVFVKIPLMRRRVGTCDNSGIRDRFGLPRATTRLACCDWSDDLYPIAAGADSSSQLSSPLLYSVDSVRCSFLHS
jgi:hypothetical protein